MTKPKPSFSPRWISTSYGCREAGTTALPLPPPPPLPMPLVDPLPELTVLREFWLPWGVRLPSVRLGAWVLLWWEEAGEGGTSPSPFDTGDEEEANTLVRLFMSRTSTTFVRRRASSVHSVYMTHAQVVCKTLLTSISGALASDSEVDMALFSSLLHQLHHQLVRLAHHRRAIHTDELIARPQAPVLICCPVLHYVPYVDLGKHTKCMM